MTTCGAARSTPADRSHCGQPGQRGDSTYAGIVRLVTEAEADASSAPFVRLADRYAGGFLLASLAMALVAWVWSGDPVRAVAVLVVATPCPLILAAPIAVTGGLSRAAAHGVIVKGGAVLERLAEARILLLDKTGTLTRGHPVVIDVIPTGSAGADELLRLAAALDQLSPHVAADAVVRAAHERAMDLPLPRDVDEVPGAGIRGEVGGRRVAVGKAAWVAPAADLRWAAPIRRRAELDGALTVFVALDDAPAGALLLRDPIRIDAGRTIRRLRRAGIKRVVMVTGDRAEVAEGVGAVIGVDAVLAERSPLDKVAAVERGTCQRADDDGGGRHQRRAGASDRRHRRGDRQPRRHSGDGCCGRRAHRRPSGPPWRRDDLRPARAGRIARQSVIVGIGLSISAMVVAGFGVLTPAVGALLQEVIDAVVIVNALRARQDRGQHPVRPDDAAVAHRFAAEHETLRPELDRITQAADALATEPVDAVPAVRTLQRFLVGDLLRHEIAEDAELYPVLDRVIGGTEPTATMSRAHVEIGRLVRRVGTLLDLLDDGDPDPVDVAELRRVLYGLHAILELHFDQEEEGYFSILDTDATAPADAEGTSASGAAGPPRS